MCRNNFVVMVAFLALVGCAPQIIWYKPGATQAQFNKDNYACQRDASVQTGFIYQGVGSFGPEVDRNLYFKCMQALGYAPRTSQTAQTSEAIQTAQAKPNPPIVTAFGSLDSSTVDRYDSFAVFFQDAAGVPGSGAMAEGVVTSSILAAGFTVVERARMQQVFEEQKVQLQHVDETAREIRIGKLVGAKAVILGTINEWKQENLNGRSLSSVSLGLRIIDVETGSILFNGQGYYARPLTDSPKVIATLLLANIIAHFGATINGGWLGSAWRLTEQDSRRVAVITLVLPGTPAEEAGLKVGDVVLFCNGATSMNWKSLRQSHKTCRVEPGQEMVLQVTRAGETLFIKMITVDRIQWIRERTTAK